MHEHVFSARVHVAEVSPAPVQSASAVHLAKEEKNQSVLKATSIHNGRNCFNPFQISIELNNTTALSGSSKQEA